MYHKCLGDAVGDDDGVVESELLLAESLLPLRFQPKADEMLREGDA